MTTANTANITSNNDNDGSDCYYDCTVQVKYKRRKLGLGWLLFWRK